MARGNGNGKHRRRRRPVPLPSLVGSVAVAAAASGALTMPQAGASDYQAAESPAATPERPQSSGGPSRGALDAVVAAQQSLDAESSENAKAAVAVEVAKEAERVERERQEAAERAARAARDANRWVVPLSGYRITAGFGSGGRLWSSRHTGLDFAAPQGTPVHAAAGGTVVSAGWDGAYGNKIVIRHADGTHTWYCHLSRMDVRSGEVLPGQQIGSVGSTGNSTGPHLHLEVRPGGGDPVNPRSWLAERGVNV
ncbi:MAG TPA: M23 family metallopeptidase [Jiangellales bacterium]|nr:M23 family metallopeptidase [Jiangellales bacterium]